MKFRPLFYFSLEKLSEKFVFHVPTQAFFCVRPSGKIRIIQTSGSMLLTCHKRDDSCQHSSYIPSCSPSLFVVVCEGSADGFISLEPTAGSIEQKPGRGKGVVFMKL